MNLHPEPTTPRHRASAAERAVPLAAIAATVLLPLSYLGSLPDPVAIHWGIDGRPDGHGPLWLDVTLIAALTALVSLLSLWGAGRADRRPARLLVGIGHASAALFVGLRWVTLQANAGADDWTRAGDVTGTTVSLVSAVAMLVGLGGWVLARNRPEHVRATRAVVATPMAPGETAAWFGDQSWGIGTAVSMLALVGAAATAVLVPPPGRGVTIGSLVLVAVALATFTRIRVAIGPHGLTVRFGILGVPRQHVALTDIEAVEVEDVEPLAYGGWGYRVVPGARAIVIRRGPGLRIRRRGRADLLVTVDDADVAAGVLAAHLAER